MKKNKKMFLYSFSISLVLLIIILVGFIVYYQNQKNYTDAQTPVEDIPKVVATEDYDLTILAIGCSVKGETADSYMLIKFDAVENKILFSALPPQTEAIINVKKDTLAGHYDYASCPQAVKAVEYLLDISVDRYVQFEKSSFLKLIDLVGGIEFEIPQDLRYVDTEKNIDIFLEKGEQQLDGKRVYDYIMFPQRTAQERIESQNQMIEAVLNQQLNEKTIREIDAIYHTMTNAVDTNVTFYDYTFRKDVFLELIGEKTTIECVPFDGTYQKDGKTFVATQDAVAQAREKFD